jgi:methylated-DNA-protein-cysteine methyltransferase-like protein
MSEAPDPEELELEQLAAAVLDGHLRWRQAVRLALRFIPEGRVIGYGQLAALLGQPRAARQVGYALAALEPGSSLPWWRVLRSDGSIALQGDPLRGPMQEACLRAEGVEVVEHRVDMARHGWRPLPGGGPVC